MKRGNYIVSVTRVTFYKCSTCVVLGFQGRSLNLRHVITTCCLGGNVYSKDYSTNQLTGLIPQASYISINHQYSDTYRAAQMLMLYIRGGSLYTAVYCEDISTP